MNKPAQKEPSMDEILSSIRQIIADDDAAVTPRPAAVAAATSLAPRPVSVAPASGLSPAPRVPDPAPTPIRPFEIPEDDEDDDSEPLSLSPEQIITEDMDEESSEGAFDAPSPSGEGLVDPDDVAFELEAEPPVAVPSPLQAMRPTAPRPAERSLQARTERESPQAAQMPDPTLSRDMAEQLLEPATKAAVRSSIARLNNLGIGTHGVTLEDMTRELLRPMLKEWLDEHLPSVVERLVEKEISRISRGVD